ncbi:MAG: glycosyltransferase [Bacteroidetes bacterium]|nr:glycosyltransferase [Bacteroidota bacterium]
MKQKIIFLVTNDLSYDQRMIRICSALSRHGYEVELVGRLRKNSVPLHEVSFRQTRLSLLFTSGKLFYIELNIRFFIYLLFQRFNAVCAIDLDTILCASLAATLKGKPLVYDAHEYFTEVPEVIRRPTVQKIWLWVEKTFVPRAALCYTVSQNLAALFESKYGVKFHLIRNFPVLNATGKIANTTTTRQLIYQGALNEGRGLENLIEAMKHLPAQLTIAGDGDLTEQLKARVKLSGLEHQVTFTGYVKPEELRKLTASAHIGVNLLENKGLSYYYSLANKFADYIHAGLPQICVAFPEYKTLNDQYQVGVLINDISTQTIKQAIERLLKDDALYVTLQKNCEVCARDLNWQKEEGKLLTLYDGLLR